MTGTTSRTCPACGVIVLRTHQCRASALIPTNVPPSKVTPIKAAGASSSSKHPASRRRPCPDHPTEPLTYCRLCELEAVAPPANWRPQPGLIEDGPA